MALPAGTCGMHSTAAQLAGKGGVEATTASAEDFLSFDMGSHDDSSKNHGGSGRSGSAHRTRKASPRRDKASMASCRGES